MIAAKGPLRGEFGSRALWSVAVTIPARNEAERIPACLDAAACALRGRGGVLVAVNGSTDETAQVVAAWFARTGVAGMLLDEPLLVGGVGRARRLAVQWCAPRLAPGAVVMTTDADSRVAPDWVDANIAELEHADLICGTVLPDPREAANLPAVIGRNGAPEGEYMALTLAARRLLDPVAHDAEPTHLNPAGASLAFRMPLYRDLCGFDACATGEDRAFAAKAEARDWRLRHSARAQVVTSCRLDGRTDGGMAGALRARISEADPLVDELLAPAAATILRARLRGDVRRRWQGAGFGAAWCALEQSTPALQCDRMRLSDIRRELPRLARAVARVHASPEQVPA